jgi:hypothetical protein
VKIVEHSAIAQEDESLIEAVAETGWVVKDLMPPARDGVEDLFPERSLRDWVDQVLWVRPAESYALLADRPPDDECVAVGRPDEGTGAMIEVPKVSADLGLVSGRFEGEVGAFEMPSPFGLEVVDLIVDMLQIVNL